MSGFSEVDIQLNAEATWPETPQRVSILAHYDDRHAQDIYARRKGQKLEFLFAGTRFSDCMDAGPILVDTKQDDDIVSRFIELAESQQGWQGLLLVTPQSLPFAQLVTLLKDRLLVEMPDKHHGLLHYANPVVAHTWLKESDAAHTAAWLGPILRVIWHAAEPWQAACWHHIDNQSPTPPDQAWEGKPWPLTQSQQQALALPAIDRQLQQLIVDTPGLSATTEQAWQQKRQHWLQAAQLELTTASDQSHYLGIAQTFPELVEPGLEHLLPDIQQKNLTTEQKLTALEQKLRGSSYA